MAQEQAKAAAAPQKKVTLKSRAKAAGVKSVFGIGDRIVMTSFGRGNDANIEKHIENGQVENKHDPEAYSAAPADTKIRVTGAVPIHTKEGEAKKISALPDFPRRPNGVLGRDVIGGKDKLEERYFGRTFNDNLHIQVIYNILDIDKILTVFLNNIVYALNNLERKSAENYDQTDFIGKGDIGLQNPYAQVKAKNGATYRHFTDYLKNPRLSYFGHAFFRQTTFGEKVDLGNDYLDQHPDEEDKWLRNHPGKRMRNTDIAKFAPDFVPRKEESVYNILALLDELRHSCVHDCDKSSGRLGRAVIYNLADDVNREVLETLDDLYWEKLQDLRDFAKNSSKCNFRIIFDALGVRTDAEKASVAQDYYRFAVLKDYKNLGFSIKQLRECITATYMPELKNKLFDSIRSKICGVMDFVLVRIYQHDGAAIERLVTALRTGMENTHKEEIYAAEARRIWTDQRLHAMLIAIRDNLKKIPEKQVDIKSYKLTPQETDLVREAIDKVSLNDCVSYFSETVYMLTLFLDGKEINDLLTTLINKFDNIAGLLRVMEKENLETGFAAPYTFFNKEAFFDAAGRCIVLEELRCINGFAKMSGESDKAKRVMFEDAVRLLGIEGHDENDMEEYLDEFLDKKKLRIKPDGKPDTGFRNFIASNVIDSWRFRYIVRFMNPGAARAFIENEKLVRFVLERIPDTQIDRYYASCGQKDGERKQKIDYLVGQVQKVQTDLFRNVEQRADAQRNAQKQRYLTVLTLYLNVLYQVTKNLVNVNSRYVMAFHNVERDGRLLLGQAVDHEHHNQKAVAEAVIAEKRRAYEAKIASLPKDVVYYKEYRREDRILRYCEQDLQNSDEAMIDEFRNSVAHLSAVRNAALYVRDLAAFESYFEIYHFLTQKHVAAAFDYACQKGWVTTENGQTAYRAGNVTLAICPASLRYVREIKAGNGYRKDFVKALCAPFMYNLARFKNLTIDLLFDRNEERERKKEALLAAEKPED